MTVCVLSEPTSSIIGTDVSCNNYCDGAASINVSSGDMPHEAVKQTCFTLDCHRDKFKILVSRFTLSFLYFGNSAFNST